MTWDGSSSPLDGTSRLRFDLSDIHSKFGFDLDDAAWLRQLREFRQTSALGRISSYELTEVIGRGGQGVVFKAMQSGTGRIIAIKRLSAGAFASPELRARFEREVETISALDHPGIVTVYGAEQVDGQLMLAMKLIDGQPFHLWSENRSPREILEAFAELCDAVQHAHQRGVIHRDIKPKNILVDRNGHPHVLDFGLAKLHSEEPSGLTHTGDFLGTFLYAAPEQFAGRSGVVDVRTDIYSLGAVLYQALTGKTMFPAIGGVKEMLDAILTTEPATPSSINPRLDREINAIVLKAVSKDKGSRYASVDALRTDVCRYLRGEAVLAHPPSFRYLARKFVRRNRAAVFTSAAFVLVLLVATTIAATLYVRAENARILVQEKERIARLEIAKQETVNRFLQDMLGRANRLKHDGRDLTMREVLDAASAQLDLEAESYEPEVEATLRMTIALSYLGIGAGDVERHLRRALDLRRQLYGDVHPSVLESAYYLARIIRTAGQLNEAEALFKLVLENRLAQNGPDSAYLAQALSSLGILQRDLGKYSDAEASYLEAIRIYRYNFGEDHHLISVLQSLGQLRKLQKKPVEAESLYRQAVEIGRRAAVDEVLDLAEPLSTGAAALRANGLKEEAWRWIEESAAIYEKKGVPSGILDRTRGDWAMEEGDLAKAEEYLSKARQTYLVAYGPDSIPVARMNTEFARLRKLLGQFEEAELSARTAVDIFDRAGIADSPDGITARFRHGISLVDLERFPDAENRLLLAYDAALQLDDHHNPIAIGGLRRDIAQELIRLYENWDAREPGYGFAEMAEDLQAGLVEEVISTR